MWSEQELDRALARIDPDALLRIRLLQAEGWFLEAKRELGLLLGHEDGDTAHAMMIRRMVCK